MNHPRFPALLPAKLMLAMCVAPLGAPAADHFWTNALGGNYSVPANWLLNSVPGPGDNAVFTNHAGYQVHMLGINPQNASAFFDAAGGIVTQSLFNSSWTLTNRYVVGREATATATVTHTVGTLRVTNSAGTAPLVIGGLGRGTYNLQGGDVVADRLVATNHSPAFTNAGFNFNSGNLLTLQGSVVAQNAHLLIGNLSNQTATWTMPRGTHVVSVDGESFTILGQAPGSRGVVLASGSDTVWSNSNWLVIGGSGSGSRMRLSEGTAVFCTFGQIGLNSASNEVWVSDPGSRWLTSGNVDVGADGPNNWMVISNGGQVAASASGVFGVIGNGPGGNSNLALVTGSGSTWSNSADLFVGISGSGNRFVLANGGEAINSGSELGTIAEATNNTAWITDAGSRWINAGNVRLGFFGSGNQVIITNGGQLISGSGMLGSHAVAHHNQIILTGTNSCWAVSSTLSIGFNGSSCHLLITNGARAMGSSGVIGSSSSSTNNAAIVTSAGSLWSNLASVSVGSAGSGNRLLVSNGGGILDQFGFVGLLAASSNNLAVVTGPGSYWSNEFNLAVGQAGSGNTLILSNNATAWVGQQFLVGTFDSSTNNRAIVDGGTLRARDGFGNGVLEVRRGTNVFNAGLIDVDQLLLTNASGRFEFNGGVLQTGNTTVTNGALFVVGNGVSAATLELLGEGTHRFASGVQIANNASLKGNGILFGNLTNASGGTLSPGASIGTLAVAGHLRLLPGSVNRFEINKSSGTNDNVIAAGIVFYSGSLIVTSLGGTLALGDRFQLFSGAAFSGSFSSLVLPALAPGLSWKNSLSMDGALQVVATPNRAFGVDVSHFQNESGIPQSSWNQMFAEGKRFVFIKATEGLTGPHDPTMSNNVSRAVAAGLLAGVYHFAHPENRPTTNGAVLEASNFVLYAGTALGPGRLRPVLDLEGSAANLSTPALTDWVIAFANEIVARRGPGAAPIVYCSQSFANFELDSRLAEFDLWIRTVGSGFDPAVDDPPGQIFPDATGVFNNWSFWQYSATGSSGGLSPLDLDVCHSEFKPLSAFIIPVPPSLIQLTGAALTTNGTFQFSFTNTPGTLFTVLAATNVALPVGSWTALGGVPEVSPGQFRFIDPAGATNAQRFYRVRSP